MKINTNYFFGLNKLPFLHHNEQYICTPFIQFFVQWLLLWLIIVLPAKPCTVYSCMVWLYPTGWFLIDNQTTDTRLIFEDDEETIITMSINKIIILFPWYIILVWKHCVVNNLDLQYTGFSSSKTLVVL